MTPADAATMRGCSSWCKLYCDAFAQAGEREREGERERVSGEAVLRNVSTVSAGMREGQWCEHIAPRT